MKTRKVLEIVYENGYSERYGNDMWNWELVDGVIYLECSDMRKIVPINSAKCINEFSDVFIDRLIERCIK